MARLASRKSITFNRGADIANQLIMNNVVVRRGVKEALKSGGRAVPMDLMAAYATFTANLIAEKDLQRKLKSIENEEKIRMREIHTAKLALQNEFKLQEEKYWGCHRVFSAESFFSESDTYRREVYTGPEPSKAKMGRKRLEKLKDLLRLLANEDEIPLVRERNVKFIAADEQGESHPERPGNIPASSAITYIRPERVKSAPSVRHTRKDVRENFPPRGRSAWAGRVPGVVKKQRTMSLHPQLLLGKIQGVEITKARKVGSTHNRTRPRSAWGVSSKGVGEENKANEAREAKKIELCSPDREGSSLVTQALLPIPQSRKSIRRTSATVRGSASLNRHKETQAARLESARRDAVPDLEIPKSQSKHTIKSRKSSARAASARQTNVPQLGEFISSKESPVRPHFDHSNSLDISSPAKADPEDPWQVKTIDFDVSSGGFSALEEFDSNRGALTSSKIKSPDLIQSSSKAEMQTESRRERRSSEMSGKQLEMAGRKGSLGKKTASTYLHHDGKNIPCMADSRRKSATANITFTKTGTKVLSCQAKPLAPRPCEKQHQHYQEEPHRPRRVSIFRRRSLSASLYGEQIQVESNLRQKVHAFLESQVEHTEEEELLMSKENESSSNPSGDTYI